MTDYCYDKITNDREVIDSRDVTGRIEYLKSLWTEATGDDPDDYAMSQDDWLVGLDDEAALELVALLELQDDAEGTPDWEYGATLVRESYWTDYVRELASDLGYADDLSGWPFCYIDWDRAAGSLLADYMDVDFEGVTYWVRA